MKDLGLGMSRSALRSVPIEMRVCVGRAKPSLADLLELGRDDVLTLDTRIEDPVEILIGDRVVAIGELIEQDDELASTLAVRLIEVVDIGDAD